MAEGKLVFGRLSTKSELREALSSPAKKRQFNIDLFSNIAKRYDIVNKLISFGLDSAWKRQLVRALPADAKHCLDLACGSGDITFLLAQKYPEDTIVVGVDIVREMLNVAVKRSKLSTPLFIYGDMEQLALANKSFDVVTASYAIRNAPDLTTLLAEVKRVLKPGGIFAILEFSKPENRCLQFFQYQILKLWGQAWGLLLYGRRHTYGYIAESLAAFPHKIALHQQFISHGFSITYSRQLGLGMIELVIMMSKE